MTAPRGARQRRSARRRARRREQRGYVVVVVALTTIVLVMMAALGIDVALVTIRSNQLQRAADAAALAGVTYSPDLPSSRIVANRALEQNGVDLSKVAVTIENPAATPRQLEVVVTDPDVPTIFGRLIRPSFSIARRSVAEYVGDVPLGSAYNSVGTGDLTGHVPGSPAALQTAWLGVSGFCAAKEHGDQISSFYDGVHVQGTDVYAACDYWETPDPSGWAENTDYDAKGYLYVVKVPCPGLVVDSSQPCPNVAVTTQAIEIQVYDPVFDPMQSNADWRIDTRSGSSNGTHWSPASVTTRFRVLGADSTPTIETDNAVLADRTFGRCWLSPCPESRAWVTLATIPAGSRGGNYLVRVSTSPWEDHSIGSNQFALRAQLGGAWSACTSIPGSPGFDAACPSVSGLKSMGVFVGASSGVAELFLSRLAPAQDYRGKRVQILLWDPGEGARSIEILPPASGTPMPIRYRTWFPGLAAPFDEDRAVGWPAPVSDTQVDVSGNIPAQGGGFPVWPLHTRLSSSKFNDRLLSIEMTIPDDYGLDALGNEVPLADDGWWKIRYTSDTGVVTDRTTWTVQLIGDPVHIVR